MDKGYQGKLTSAEDILNNLDSYTNKEKNLLNVSYHSSLPYVIVCYSPECNASPPFHSNWDNITLSCRGIILDVEQRKVVAKPWNKFFNYNPEQHTNKLTSNSSILEKLDGSLGILYFDPLKQNPLIATKGSFNSDMTFFANDWLKFFINKNGNVFNPNYTYLFEIIYPENKIVIPYGDRKECVLLSIIDTQTYSELNYSNLIDLNKSYNLSIPKKYDFKSFYNIVHHCKNLPWDEEGYVVTLSTSEGQFKYKIKSEQYKIVHHLLSQTTPKAIYNMIRDDMDFNSIVKVLPEPYLSEYTNIYESMLNKVDTILKESNEIFKKIYRKNITEKEFALEVMENYPEYQTFLFNLLKNRGNRNKKEAIKTINYQDYNIRKYQSDSDWDDYEN